MMNFNKTILMLAVAALASQVDIIANHEGKHSVNPLLKKAKKVFTDLKTFKRCKKTEHGCPSELRWRLQKRSSYLAKGVKKLVGGDRHQAYGLKRHFNKSAMPSEKAYSSMQHDHDYYSN